MNRRRRFAGVRAAADGGRWARRLLRRRRRLRCRRRARRRRSPGRTCHPTSSGCCRASAASGTLCRRRGSRRSRTAASAGSPWRPPSATRRAQRFQHWQALPPRAAPGAAPALAEIPGAARRANRPAVRENFHRFQQLPPERRQMLREQWRNATPAQRQQMILHAREQRQKQMQRAPAPHAGPHHRTTEVATAPVRCACRTGIGTLQTSTCPAGTLNQSSWRLRRASR